MRDETSGGIYIIPDIEIDEDEEEGGEEPNSADRKRMNKQTPYPSMAFSLDIHGVDRRYDLQDNGQFSYRNSNFTKFLTYSSNFTDPSTPNQSVLLGRMGLACNFERANNNTFCRSIASAIQSNLEDGSITRESLVNKYRKDNFYTANEDQPIEYDTKLHDHLLNEVKKVDKERGEGGGSYMFREVLPNALDSYFSREDPTEENQLRYSVAYDMTRVLGSIMTNGIHPDKLLTTYLDALTTAVDNPNKSASAIDGFLSQRFDSDEALSHRLRALPIGSKYHNTFIRNQYKNC